MEANLLQVPQVVINMAILARLEEIDKKLDKKVAYLLVEDAVNEFHKQHLSRVKKKTRENYKIVLERFQSDFAGRNLADSVDITPNSIIEFIEKHYGDCKEGTKALNFNLVESFINRCRQFQIRKGLPDFVNPCDALKGEYGKSEPKTIEFTDETLTMMRRLIDSAENDRMKVTFIVLCTSGMRAGEICSTRKQHINGQIITLNDHKGIRYNTHNPKPAIAVIPKIVAEMIERMNTDRPFISYRALHNAFHVRIKVGILPPDTIRHDLRKYVYTYWLRKNEPFMAQFIIRHKSDKSVTNDPMSSIYLAPLTHEQAIEKMQILEAELGL